MPSSDQPASPPGAAPADSTRAKDLKIRGQLTCLAEEMQRRHGVKLAPVHDHLVGVRTEEGELYTLLKTATSAFLFSDVRFQKRTLILSGRTFPPTSLLEVTRVDWLKGDRVFEVYYWCEVCSIRTMDPGPCACCQGPVELRERPEGGGPETIIPAAAAVIPEGAAPDSKKESTFDGKESKTKTP